MQVIIDIDIDQIEDEIFKSLEKKIKKATNEALDKIIEEQVSEKCRKSIQKALTEIDIDNMALMTIHKSISAHVDELFRELSGGGARLFYGEPHNQRIFEEGAALGMMLAKKEGLTKEQKAELNDKIATIAGKHMAERMRKDYNFCKKISEILLENQKEAADQ